MWKRCGRMRLIRKKKRMVAEWQAVDKSEVRLGNTNGLALRAAAPRPLSGFGRRFGDLKVRPKLMVLHNAFFLVLTCAVYFSVITFAEQRLTEAAEREVTLVQNAFAALSLGGDETDCGATTSEPGRETNLASPRR